MGCAVAIDLALGEPPNALHPVVWIGNTIGAGVRIAPKTGRIAQLAYGAVLALGIPLAFAAAAAWVSARVAGWPWFGFVVTVLLFKSTFALRALGRAAHVVRDALTGGSVDDGRRALGSLCSRDASAVGEPEQGAATIE
jgi:adenosylcobinamide-phosphate synthase